MTLTLHSYRRWLIAGVVALWAFLTCATAAADVQAEAGPTVADAQRVAQATGRDVLLLFSHDANDAATATLQATLGETFIVLHQVVPPLPAPTPEQQAEHPIHKYKLTSLPAAVVADDRLQPYARMFYAIETLEEALERLGKVSAVRVARDAALYDAREAMGSDKAYCFDLAMEAVGEEIAGDFYRAYIEKIVGLDAGNALGLRDKYEARDADLKVRRLIDRLATRVNRVDHATALQALDMFVDRYQPSPRMLQRVAAVRGDVLYRAGEVHLAFAQLDAAIAMDTLTPLAKRLRGRLSAMGVRGEV